MVGIPIADFDINKQSLELVNIQVCVEMVDLCPALAPVEAAAAGGGGAVYRAGGGAGRRSLGPVRAVPPGGPAGQSHPRVGVQLGSNGIHQVATNLILTPRVL